MGAAPRAAFGKKKNAKFLGNEPIALWLRITLDGERAIGPGKVRLLELINETGSISAAGRELGMSWTRAWSLVQDVNAIFQQPLVQSQPGGVDGGGAILTPTGHDVVRRYRAIEARASVAVQGHLKAIEALAAPASAKSPLRPPRRRRA